MAANWLIILPYMEPRPRKAGPLPEIADLSRNLGKPHDRADDPTISSASSHCGCLGIKATVATRNTSRNCRYPLRRTPRQTGDGYNPVEIDGDSDKDQAGKRGRGARFNSEEGIPLHHRSGVQSKEDYQLLQVRHYGRTMFNARMTVPGALRPLQKEKCDHWTNGKLSVTIGNGVNCCSEFRCCGAPPRRGNRGGRSNG